MYNVEDYNALYNNAVHPVICEGWHCFTKMEVGLIKLVLPRHFLVPVPNQESVMYLCVRDIDFPIGFCNRSDSVVFGFFILIRWLSLNNII